MKLKFLKKEITSYVVEMVKRGCNFNFSITEVQILHTLLIQVSDALN